MPKAATAHWRSPGWWTEASSPFERGRRDPSTGRQVRRGPTKGSPSRDRSPGRVSSSSHRTCRSGTCGRLTSRTSRSGVHRMDDPCPKTRSCTCPDARVRDGRGRSSAPHDWTLSMYLRPSTSSIHAPSPFTMKGGTPPKAPNARAGEFTPPGMDLPRFLERLLRPVHGPLCGRRSDRLPRPYLDSGRHLDQVAAVAVHAEELGPASCLVEERDRRAVRGPRRRPIRPVRKAKYPGAVGVHPVDADGSPSIRVEDNPLPIWGPSRFPFPTPLIVEQHLPMGSVGVHHTDVQAFEGRTTGESDPATVGGPRGEDVARLRGPAHVHGIGAIRVHDEDRHRTFPVRVEDDPRTIGREGRVEILGGIPGEPGQILPIGPNHIDLIVAVAVRAEHQLRTVWREPRRQIGGGLGYRDSIRVTARSYEQDGGCSRDESTISLQCADPRFNSAIRRLPWRGDRKSTRLNSSHVKISY